MTGAPPLLDGLSSSTAAALNRWIKVRRAAPGVDALFVSTYQGKPLTVPGLRTILRKLGEAAGIPNVSTHAFRRGFAVIATEAGAPTRVVQDAGRWSDISMVERYTLGLRRGLLYGNGWSPADLASGDESNG